MALVRKAISFVVVTLLLPGAFAQYASFYNRLSSVLVIQNATEGASPSFGSVSNRIVGRYDSEKFTLWGRAEFTITSDDRWKGNVELEPSIMEFAGAMRPFPFLELILGKGYGGSKGEFALTGYTLTGAFGYATEASYGLRKWADGEGFTLLFRGDGLGIEGLRIGWNAFPFLRNSQEHTPTKIDGDYIPYGALLFDNKARWYTTLSLNYTLAQLITFNLAARLDTATDSNQTVGIYTEFIGAPGLRANAGVTLDTKTELADPFYVLTQVRSMVWYSPGNLFPADLRFQVPDDLTERGLSTAINAGVEYSFNGLGLPLMLAADMGITAGRREVFVDEDAGLKTTILPLLVGGLVQYNITDPLLFRLQVRYADNLADEETKRDSAISIMPRLHYNAGKIGEFRLEPVVLLTKSGTADWVTGFLVGAFWQYNF